MNLYYYLYTKVENMKKISIDTKTLFFDTDILFLDVPILRVYRQINDSFFVFSCIDPDDYVYLAFETTRQKLIQMLTGERQLLDIFTDVSNSIYYLVEFDVNFSIEEYKTLKIDEVPDDYLPVEGKSLKLSHDKNIRDYIEKLKLEEKRKDLFWSYFVTKESMNIKHLDISYVSLEKIVISRWAYSLASELIRNQFSQIVTLQKSQQKPIYIGLKHSEGKIAFGQIPRKHLAEGKYGFAELKN
jgi:hypothetical protein